MDPWKMLQKVPVVLMFHSLVFYQRFKGSQHTEYNKPNWAFEACSMAAFKCVNETQDMQISLG